MPAAVSSPLQAVLFWNVVISCYVGTKLPFYQQVLLVAERLVQRKLSARSQSNRMSLWGCCGTNCKEALTWFWDVMCFSYSPISYNSAQVPMPAIICCAVPALSWRFYQFSGKSTARESKEQLGLSHFNKSTMKEKRTRLLMFSSRLSFPSSVHVHPAAMWLTSSTQRCLCNCAGTSRMQLLYEGMLSYVRGSKSALSDRQRFCIE